MTRPERVGDGSWLVLNQSQSPQFQAMLVGASERIGPCLLVTGTSFPGEAPRLRVIEGPPYARGSLLRRGWSWVRFLNSSARHALLGRRPRLLFVTTNPPFLPHLAWLTFRARKVPYVILFWDIYPDHAVQQGWLRAGGLITRAWVVANRSAMRHAAKVVTIGEAMAQALSEQAPGVAVEVIPNWADTEHIRPTPKRNNPFAIAHRQGNAMTVLYSGNIGKAHGLLTLIEAAELLKEEESIAFLVVGDGLGLAELMERSAQENLRNVAFLPYQPWDRLPEVLTTGDVAVVSQAPGTEALSVPSKTYSYMAAGCALLGMCEESSELGRLILENGIGLVAAHSDPTRLVSHIERFCREPEFLTTCQANSRAVAEREYSSEVALERFEAALLPLFRDRPGMA